MFKDSYHVIDKATCRASRYAGSVGAAAVIAMMFLTTVDVVLRYFFNRPIAGSAEVTEYLMVITISLTLAYCAVIKGHVRVEVFVSLLSKKAQAFTHSFVLLLGVILFGLLTWQTAIQAVGIYGVGSYSTVLLVPVYPFVWVLFIGGLLITLVFLRDPVSYTHLTLPTILLV